MAAMLEHHHLRKLVKRAPPINHVGPKKEDDEEDEDDSDLDEDTTATTTKTKKSRPKTKTSTSSATSLAGLATDPSAHITTPTHTVKKVKNTIDTASFVTATASAALQSPPTLLDSTASDVSSPSQFPIIIAAAAGGAALFLLLALVGFCCYRKRRRQVDDGFYGISSSSLRPGKGKGRRSIRLVDESDEKSNGTPTSEKAWIPYNPDPNNSPTALSASHSIHKPQTYPNFVKAEQAAAQRAELLSRNSPSPPPAKQAQDVMPTSTPLEMEVKPLSMSASSKSSTRAPPPAPLDLKSSVSGRSRSLSVADTHASSRGGSPVSPSDLEGILDNFTQKQRAGEPAPSVPQPVREHPARRSKVPSTSGRDSPQTVQSNSGNTSPTGTDPPVGLARLRRPSIKSSGPPVIGELTKSVSNFGIHIDNPTYSIHSHVADISSVYSPSPTKSTFDRQITASPTPKSSTSALFPRPPVGRYAPAIVRSDSRESCEIIAHAQPIRSNNRESQYSDAPSSVLSPITPSGWKEDTVELRQAVSVNHIAPAAPRLSRGDSLRTKDKGDDQEVFADIGSSMLAMSGTPSTLGSRNSERFSGIFPIPGPRISPREKLQQDMEQNGFVPLNQMGKDKESRRSEYRSPTYSIYNVFADN